MLSVFELKTTKYTIKMIITYHNYLLRVAGFGQTKKIHSCWVAVKPFIEPLSVVRARIISSGVLEPSVCQKFTATAAFQMTRHARSGTTTDQEIYQQAPIAFCETSKSSMRVPAPTKKLEA